MRPTGEEESKVPDLNLYNFEDDQFAGSQYVLTSPRSLEACDMLSVKPVELLYKPLSDFQDEMREKGLCFQDAYTEYDRCEKNRQRKLRECRDYRDKMIRDRIGDQSDVGNEGIIVDTEEPASETNKHTFNSAPILQNHSSDYPNGHLVSSGEAFETPFGVRNESWRTHPPYSERHLHRNSHLLNPPTDSGSYQGHKPYYTGLTESLAAKIQTSNRDMERFYSYSNRPQPRYKSSFMRRKLDEDTQHQPVSVVGSRHRRAHTDGVIAKSNRTSTPYDAAAGRESAIDRAFTAVTSTEHTSPSPIHVYQHQQQPERRRTASASGGLEQEINRLRKIKSTRDDVDMNQTGRSLSLTDLYNQPPEASVYRPSKPKTSSHIMNGYSSARQYNGRHDDETIESLIAQLLDRRQRKLEEDLRVEQLNYKYEVDRLHGELQDMKISEDKFRKEVDNLNGELERNNWRRFYMGTDKYLYGREEVTPKYYVGETLADKTQRERQLEREKEERDINARLRESVEYNTRKPSKLDNRKWRKAFDTALERSKSRWEISHMENGVAHSQPLSEEEMQSYSHIAEVLKKSVNSNDAPDTQAMYRSQDYDRLRSSLQREESPLTEEAVRRHELLSSVSPQRKNLRMYSAINGNSIAGNMRYDTDDQVPPPVDHVTGYTNGHMEDVRQEEEGYIRRPAKPTDNITHRKDKTISSRLSVEEQRIMEERVREMKAELEERRRKLNDKLRTTSRQTEELRAARLESERKERLRRQQKANKRVIRDRSSNRRNSKAHNSYRQYTPNPIVEQVRPLKQTSMMQNSNCHNNRDTFDKKVLKAELDNWVRTGQRSRSRTRSANRNESQFTLA